MSFDVAGIQAGVASAFALLGQPFTLRTTTGETFDPNTGAYTGATNVDRIVSGINSGRERRWVNGTLVVDDQYVIYILDDGTAPSANEVVLMDGKKISIQSVDEYQVVGTKLAYRVVLNR